MENPGEKHSEVRKHAITSYENKDMARESCGKSKPRTMKVKREAFTGTGNEFACLKV